MKYLLLIFPSSGSMHLSFFAQNSSIIVNKMANFKRSSFSLFANDFARKNPLLSSFQIALVLMKQRKHFTKLNL